MRCLLQVSASLKYAAMSLKWFGMAEFSFSVISKSIPARTSGLYWGAESDLDGVGGSCAWKERERESRGEMRCVKP